jgi:hypothetical protein
LFLFPAFRFIHKDPNEKVIQAYRNFAKLAGEDPDYYPRKN